MQCPHHTLVLATGWTKRLDLEILLDNSGSEERRMEEEREEWKKTVEQTEQLSLSRGNGKKRWNWKKWQNYWESMPVKIKSWDDALRNKITKMPNGSIEILSWFISVENIFDQLKVSDKFLSDRISQCVREIWCENVIQVRPCHITQPTWSLQVISKNHGNWHGFGLSTSSIWLIVALTGHTVSHICWDNFDINDETPSSAGITHITHDIVDHQGNAQGNDSCVPQCAPNYLQLSPAEQQRQEAGQCCQKTFKLNAKSFRCKAHGSQWPCCSNRQTLQVMTSSHLTTRKTDSQW